MVPEPGRCLGPEGSGSVIATSAGWLTKLADPWWIVGHPF